MNRREIGSCYEDQAAVYLQQQGVVILEKNYRCRLGEIDLIGWEGDYLVFVEVKYRSSFSFGDAAEAVTAAKQRIIYRVAQTYINYKRLGENKSCRFDVVAINGDGKIRHYRNAFGGI